MGMSISMSMNWVCERVCIRKGLIMSMKPEYENEVWVWVWGLSMRMRIEYEYEGWPISSDWDNLAALTVFPMQAGPLPQRSGWKVSSFTKTQWQRQRQFYSMSPLSSGSTQFLRISIFVKGFPGKGSCFYTYIDPSDYMKALIDVVTVWVSDCELVTVYCVTVWACERRENQYCYLAACPGLRVEVTQ